jgi:hypothetical protein
MSDEKRSYLADFTDPDKIDYMAHFTPEQHRAFVSLKARAERMKLKRVLAWLDYYQKTTRSVMYKPARVGSEQEVEVLRQHKEAVERVDSPPEEFTPKGLFPVNNRKKKVMVDGEADS